MDEDGALRRPVVVLGRVPRHGFQESFVTIDAERDLVLPPPAPALPVLGAGGEMLGCFRVGRVFCVGRNYAAHAREMGADPDREAPFFFMKSASCVTTAEGVRYPATTRSLHHEVELVVALGPRTQVGDADGSSVAEVFACAVGVDLTCRDVQAELKALARPWEAAKAFPESAPCGALRLGGDVLGRPDAELCLSVNGVERQRGALMLMMHDVPAILAELDVRFGLQPGDLVFTGTPAGVSALERGDRVHATLDDLPPLFFEVV